MKIFIGLFLTTCLVVIGIFFATPPTNGQKEQKDEATIVQKGQVTEKEREYSKEYKKLYSYRYGRKLSELSELGKRRGYTQEAGISIGLPLIPTIGNSPAVTASEFLRNLSCAADAIVVGIVRSKAAHLTEDETFVYTEYVFSVEDILKNNSASHVEVNNSIEFTRPGGLIKLDNQVIRVEDKSYPQLETKKKYLLFLKFIPSTNGYMVYDARSDFILENNSFKTLSRLGVPKEIESKNEPQSLIYEVRNSVSPDCQKSGGMATGRSIIRTGSSAACGCGGTRITTVSPSRASCTACATSA